MLTSMTGFGRAQADLPGSGNAVVEVRSVNHRFLEVDCRLPEGLQAFEENVRAAVARAMDRGQVRVWVSVKGTREAAAVRFQEPVARGYLRELEKLRDKLGLAGEVSLSMLLGLPQVMAVTERADFPSVPVWKKIERAVAEAVAEAVRMRRREGKRLEKTLRQRIDLFEDLSGKIRRRVPTAQEGLRQRLAERIASVLKETGREIPAGEAILREAAAMVQSTDVAEELERIASHLKAFRAAMEGRPAGAKQGKQSSPGRTLDFLAQEMHREVNTLGTKLRDGAIGRWVIEFKGQIEKLREQAANIE